MDAKTLMENLAEELISGWEIVPTGSGFLVLTDRRWPDDNRIELHVRTVGEREDLFIVTDGGDLFGLLFSHGIDLAKDDRSMRTLTGIAERYEVKVVDFQVVRGSNAGGISQSIRLMLEAVKEAAFLLWREPERAGSVH